VSSTHPVLFHRAEKKEGKRIMRYTKVKEENENIQVKPQGKT
jgi:hypothetical protein